MVVDRLIRSPIYQSKEQRKKRRLLLFVSVCSGAFRLSTLLKSISLRAILMRSGRGWPTAMSIPCEQSHIVTTLMDQQWAPNQFGGSSSSARNIALVTGGSTGRLCRKVSRGR